MTEFERAMAEVDAAFPESGWAVGPALTAHGRVQQRADLFWFDPTDDDVCATAYADTEAEALRNALAAARQAAVRP